MEHGYEQDSERQWLEEFTMDLNGLNELPDMTVLTFHMCLPIKPATEEQP